LEKPVVATLKFSLALQFRAVTGSGGDMNLKTFQLFYGKRFNRSTINSLILISWLKVL
jgi:hypothetical protein